MAAWLDAVASKALTVRAGGVAYAGIDCKWQGTALLGDLPIEAAKQEMLGLPNELVDLCRVKVARTSVAPRLLV